MPKSNGVARDFDSAVMSLEVDEEGLEFCNDHEESLRGSQITYKIEMWWKVRCCLQI